MELKLVDEWKWVVAKAWSLRLMAVSAALSGAEVAMQYVAPHYPSGRFAAAAAVVTMLAAGARLVAQKAA